MKAEDVVGTAARERYKLNNFRVPIEDAVEARIHPDMVTLVTPLPRA